MLCRNGPPGHLEVRLFNYRYWDRVQFQIDCLSEPDDLAPTQRSLDFETTVHVLSLPGNGQHRCRRVYKQVVEFLARLMFRMYSICVSQPMLYHA